MTSRRLRTLLSAGALCWVLALQAALGQSAPQPVGPAILELAYQAVLADDIYAVNAHRQSRFIELHPGYELISDPKLNLLMAWRYDADRRHLSLVFRGTVSATNWLDNLRQGLRGSTPATQQAPEAVEERWLAQSRDSLDGGGQSADASSIYPRSRQLIEALLRQQGLQPVSVSLSGHSLGGGLAQYNALFFPGLATVYAFNPAALNVRTIASTGVTQQQAVETNRFWLYSTRYHGAGCGTATGARRDTNLPCLVMNDVVSSLSQNSRLLSEHDSVQLGPLNNLDIYEVEDAWPLGWRIANSNREALKPWILLALSGSSDSGENQEDPQSHKAAPPQGARLERFKQLLNQANAGRLPTPGRPDQRQQALQRYEQHIRPAGTDLRLLYTRPAHSMRLLRLRLCSSVPTPQCQPSNAETGL